MRQEQAEREAEIIAENEPPARQGIPPGTVTAIFVRCQIPSESELDRYFDADDED